ncbi:MAG: N-acetyl-gamma-glutamyl-phosphate reductase [Deltaproteobacteria bacterium]|nr:N-acetyl-gamma-glutamyl-phosphate reductase [Deltaproteobacteria bacterium]
MIKTGIYGASGYTGQELLRLLLRHPGVKVAAVTSRTYKGKKVADVFPAFRNLTDLQFMDASPDETASRCDVVFIALPHGDAMAAAVVFHRAGVKVIDLSADFRLRDVKVYEKWYAPHTAPELLADSVYGLPECYRDAIRKAKLVANPGCYPTSVILGLAPLVKGTHADLSSIIVDSKSGVSGAGRTPELGMLFCEVSEGFKAYKIGVHRHAPEMEQELSALAGSNVSVVFVPHLIPVNRGILSTMYVSLKVKKSAAELIGIYREFYRDEPFVRVYDEGSFPSIASVRGSNFCDIGLAVDTRSGRAIVMSCIDNLVKGAAGQAIQNMNIMCGFDEGMGLDAVPLFP